jgi:hypothetical protein
MTPGDLQSFALSLRDAHEAPHFERTSFRVGKKIFATMTLDGREAMVRVPEQARLKALLKEHPDIFFSYGTWTYKNGALGVHLAKVEPSLMRELVTDAWRSIAPKHALQDP